MTRQPCATLTVPEVAGVLGVSPTTLYDLIRRQAIDLKVHRIGRQLRVSQVNLDAYLAGETGDTKAPPTEVQPPLPFVPRVRRTA